MELKEFVDYAMSVMTALKYGIHAMELKGRKTRGESAKQKVESMQWNWKGKPHHSLYLAARQMNPCNGIESQLHAVLHGGTAVPQHTNPFNGIERETFLKIAEEEVVWIHSMELKE